MRGMNYDLLRKLSSKAAAMDVLDKFAADREQAHLYKWFKVSLDLDSEMCESVWIGVHRMS